MTAEQVSPGPSSAASTDSGIYQTLPELKAMNAARSNAIIFNINT